MGNIGEATLTGSGFKTPQDLRILSGLVGRCSVACGRGRVFLTESKPWVRTSAKRVFIMIKEASAISLVTIPETSTPPALNQLSVSSRRMRLLDVSDVAEWLGVSKGWVRDHASGRRQSRLLGIKFGSAKGKGLWKFREEDIHQFIQQQRGHAPAAF